MKISKGKQWATIAFLLSIGLLLVINFSVTFSPVVHIIALPLLLITILILIAQAFKVN